MLTRYASALDELRSRLPGAPRLRIACRDGGDAVTTSARWTCGCRAVGPSFRLLLLAPCDAHRDLVDELTAERARHALRLETLRDEIEGEAAALGIGPLVVDERSDEKLVYHAYADGARGREVRAAVDLLRTRCAVAGAAVEFRLWDHAR